MAHRWMVWLVYALTGMFFTGLAGCVLVVVISWVTILRSGLSRDS